MVTNLTPDEVAELRRLLAAATPTCDCRPELAWDGYSTGRFIICELHTALRNAAPALIAAWEQLHLCKIFHGDYEQLRQRAEVAERERDAAIKALKDAEVAIMGCAALKDWGETKDPVTHHASRVNFLCRIYDGCVATLGAIADQRDALLEDKARLDWLDQQDNGCLPSMLYLGGPWRAISHERVAVGKWKFEDHPELGSHESVREAIDAARKERQ